ncbi:hypothetical protein [Aliiglaciecola litoralis]|uniref:Uncharacterized protein n=1 Tax=Aliiglaciecola litoralis TaxID=582857 RepID=A0ABP3WQ73_9ALTE
MNKIIMLVITSFILTSCANNRNNFARVTTCDDDENSPARAEISYKYKVDSELEMGMRLKFSGKAGNRFEIKLKPKGSGSNDVKVHTIGVSGTLPNGDPTDYTWLNGSGSYNSTRGDGNNIVLCVPSDIPEDTVYKFDVKVDTIGTIDPRFRVSGR